MFMKLRTLVHRVLLGMQRSHKWPALRRRTIQGAGCCAACGRTTNLTVHHIQPFHLYPALELEPTNLIVLCENKDGNCHLRIGHGRDWDIYNPNVVTDAAMLRGNPLLQATVWANARNAAITHLPQEIAAVVDKQTA